MKRFILYVLLSAIALWSSDAAFLEAEKKFFAREHAAALPLLLAVAEKNPAHPKAFSYIGDIYLLQKEYRMAITWYNKALANSPDPAAEHFRIAQGYQELHEIEKSLTSYQEAYTLNPSLHPALFQIGYLQLMEKRDKEKTIFYWRTFIQAAPDDPQSPTIEKILFMIEDPTFELPPPGSEISLEEVLRLGGKKIESSEIKTETKIKDYEKDKEKNKQLGLPDDDMLE